MASGYERINFIQQIYKWDQTQQYEYFTPTQNLPVF
jgi:hypothetical protein